MSAPLACYFADLFKEHGGEDHAVIVPELVDDNARLPSPCMGHQPLSGSEILDSCHTRSTISTCASSIMSNSSSHSHASTGSNGSSCRWDSNPSSKVEKTDQLKRPKRPGRKNSDSNKHKSKNNDDPIDRPVERPSRSSSSGEKSHSRNCDKPQRPSRTSSSNENSKHIHATESLDKMLLHGSKQLVDSDSSSENSLKEIFRSSSRQRRPSNNNNVKPTTRTSRSPPRTVNEILGQSMEELKIAW